jgi:hypothetical protein
MDWSEEVRTLSNKTEHARTLAEFWHKLRLKTEQIADDLLPCRDKEFGEVAKLTGEMQDKENDWLEVVDDLSLKLIGAEHEEAKQLDSERAYMESEFRRSQ